MKSLLVKLGVILIIGLAIFTYAEVRGADWRFFSETKMHFFYYDPESLTFSSQNVVKVWHKVVYKEKGETHHEVYLAEINCADKKSVFCRGLPIPRRVTFYKHSKIRQDGIIYSQAQWARGYTE